MLNPEDIRSYRSRRGLTQKEFSDLLGIGIATLNRYENGALQSEAHDRIIKLAMEPQNFLNLFSKSALPKDETFIPKTSLNQNVWKRGP